MKISELFWERVGFGLLGAIVGAAYALVASLVIVLFLKKMTFIFLLKVFCTVFGVAGLVFGKSMESLIRTGAYPIYFIWGAFLGAASGSGALTGDADGLVPQKKGAGLYLTVLGAIAVLACFVIW